MRLPSSVLRFAAALACFAVLACFSRLAKGETFEAPLGGKPIVLGEARVACVATIGGWRTEPGGRSVRPPTIQAAVGVAVDLRVAPSASDCPRATASVRLIATAPWPAFDMSSILLAVDEGRLEARGRGLHGVLLTWPLDTGRASEACHDLKIDAGVE